jgi:hypothetical protein
MNQIKTNVARVLGAGAAAAALAVSLVTPAAAGPNPPKVAPNLVLESISATPGFGRGVWNVQATLRNKVTNYPGGGELAIWRTSGGTILTSPPIGEGFPAVDDQGKLLTSKPIPAMAVGDTLTISTTTTGRAIFVAEARSIPHELDSPGSGSPLAENSPSDNSKSVNILLSKQIDIAYDQLTQLIGGTLSQFQLHLNSSGAYAKLPGLYESHWNIADATQKIGALEYHWSVNDVNLTKTDPAMYYNTLVLTHRFETTASELKATTRIKLTTTTTVNGKDLNASPIEVRDELPVQYNGQFQMFFLGAPKVTAHASLGLAATYKWLQSDFDAKLANPVRDMFGYDKVNEKLQYELNHAIRQQLLKGGRIVGVSFQPGAIRLNAEVGG